MKRMNRMNADKAVPVVRAHVGIGANQRFSLAVFIRFIRVFALTPAMRGE